MNTFILDLAARWAMLHNLAGCVPYNWMTHRLAARAERVARAAWFRAIDTRAESTWITFAACEAVRTAPLPWSK